MAMGYQRTLWRSVSRTWIIAPTLTAEVAQQVGHPRVDSAASRSRALRCQTNSVGDYPEGYVQPDHHHPPGQLRLISFGLHSASIMSCPDMEVAETAFAGPRRALGKRGDAEWRVAIVRVDSICGNIVSILC